MEPIVLRTDRLVLRAPTTDDIDAIFAACQDPAIPRFTSVPSPYSREDAEDFVRLTAQWWSDASQTVWAVTHESVLTGMIGLHHIKQGSAELGYWAVADHRGRGFITEAAHSVVEWGFDALSLARIDWRAVAGNLPSAAVARAIGFRFEGTMRQAFVHGKHRDDGWVAGLLPEDDRAPVSWSVLSD